MGDVSPPETEKRDGMPRKQQPGTMPSGSLRTVLKDSDWMDMLLMLLGTMGSVADGSAMALIMLVLSSMMNAYARVSLFLDDINSYALALFYVALGVASGAFLGKLFESAGSIYRLFCGRMLASSMKIAAHLFASQVVSNISTDTLTLQGVLTEKIANFIMNLTTFLTGLLMALYLSWRLAIVAIPALLLLIIPGLVYGKLLGEVGLRIQEAYEVAGSIAEQAFSSIKIVYSFVGEERMAKGYKAALEPTLKLGIRQGLMKGMAIGTIGVTFAVWALQAWYGSTLIINRGAKGGNVFTAGVCIVYSGLALGGALINGKYFMEANIAASRIFEMIHRSANIDGADGEGKTMSDIKGEVEFQDIDFAYPSRPGTLVLSQFKLRVMPGHTVGLVGKSGSGKSTVINLLERFYEPLRGAISLDGIDIKTFQLKWLRAQMGLVSQEPLLFATSIKENILFGKEEASVEDVIKAARDANAHSFICQLPEGYDTQVGQLGSQLSEGQKQRICIARALLRDPRIPLLDEATSALDALKQASIGRTTIVIAHRLCSLRNANSIAVIQSGKVVESGSHEQLMQHSGGTYSTMVNLQRTFMSDDVASEASSIASMHMGTSGPDELEAASLSQSFSLHSKTNQQQQDNCSPPSLWQLMSMARPDWKSTLIGCIGALGYGVIQPFHSFCMAGVLAVYFANDHSEIRSQTRIYCIVFLAFSVSAFLTNVIQHYCIGMMGERLTKRVREALFTKILTFEIEWFDQEDNNSGALCSRLVTDSTMLRNLVADRLALLTQAASAATSAVVLGMVLSWRLALLATAMQPLIIGAFYLRAITMRNMSKKILKAQNKSSELASEAVGNHRIIAAFYSQDKVAKLFDLTQVSPKKESHKQSWYAGLGLFVSQFLTSANTALIFWYGGKLIFHQKITYKHLFQTFFVLVSTGRVIAETGSMTADISKGTVALKSVFAILKRQSKMDPDFSDAIKPERIHGEIEFKEVHFFYPTRQKQMILRGLNLKIDAGEVTALVGQSGSGKSTIIKLIQRFYDTSSGSVEVDGTDIRCYNLRTLRSHIALVSQEPTLFAGTIRDNIAYGKENATEAEIIAAATTANAHDFISSMKDGYETYCGERGVQLSGGQKQRIALARAILKTPAMLLLDEATSALDVNSEKLVQNALEKAMGGTGRTCLAVAHRLSTIQNAHKISVIEKARIIEEGTHSELLAKGDHGAYYSLVKLQQLSTLW